MQRFFEFATNHWDLFLALFVVLAMLIAPIINRRLRGFKEVDATEAVAMMNHQDAVLLDVRENNEYGEGHVADSLHLPLSTLPKNLQQIEKVRQRPIIVGCRSGHRSSRACGILRKSGFEQVYNLKGGMMAWESAGLPLTRGKDKKKRKAANG